jgi:diacylglycerol O-acyltransferase
MNQLSGLDTAFILQESTYTPMHICPVLIYGPDETNQQTLSLSTIKQAFSNSLTTAPILTQKLLSLPLRVDEPYWTVDKNFSIDQHFNEQTLPSPGDWDQFKAVAANIHSKGLDLKRPLWHATLITGLDDITHLPKGSSAVVLKIHHAAVDGVSLSRLIATIHGDISNIITASPANTSAPNLVERWHRANFKNFNRPYKLMRTVSRLVPAMSKISPLKRTTALTSKTHHANTRFNTQVTPNRVIGSALLRFEDLKTIKRKVRRVTYNDIALSIVGGAIRLYLEHHNDLPKKSLVCGAPINLRQSNDSSTGNKIATMQVGLATDIANPVERLRAVHQYALIGKASINNLGTGTIMDISDSMAPGILAEGLKVLRYATTVGDIPLPFHVIISNVPGPAKPISLDQHPLHWVIGLGPIRHSMGVFHVITRCADNHAISFTSCSSIMPDPTFYEQCLNTSAANLLDAALTL